MSVPTRNKFIISGHFEGYGCARNLKAAHYIVNLLVHEFVTSTLDCIGWPSFQQNGQP